MFDRFKSLSEFRRNVLILLSGTALASAIPIILSPLLTRLYSPDQFGLFALYTSLTAILSSIITGRYDMAIMLSENDEDAFHILLLSIMIALLLTLVSIMTIAIFHHQLASWIPENTLTPWLYWIPVTLFFSGLYQILYNWANRKKKFSLLSYGKILQSSISIGSAVIFGWIGYTSGGLIAGALIASITTVLFMLIPQALDLWPLIHTFSTKKMCHASYRHIRFPLYDIPSTLANTLSHQTPNMLFNLLGQITTAGYYYLIQRIMGLPSAVFASSITHVFREKAIYEFRVHGNARHLFLKLLRKLTLLGIIPFMLMVFFSEELFVFFFGKAWATAGTYAGILSPMFFLQFIASPLSYILYVTENQRINLILQSLMLLQILFGFGIGYLLDNIFWTISLISAGGSMVYLSYILVAYAQSKGH